MENLLRKIEISRGKEVLSIVEKWMKIYSLELKEVNGIYELYSKAIEDKICDIEDECKLIDEISEYINANSSDYPSKSFSEDNLLEVNYDYYKLKGEHLDKVNQLNLLQWLCVSSREGFSRSNVELIRKARKNGIELVFGECGYNEYQGIEIDSNLIEILKLHNIKYPDRLLQLTTEPMADHIEVEDIVLELDNQKYKVSSWIGNLNCNGCYTTSNWIDFNSIERI